FSSDSVQIQFRFSSDSVQIQFRFNSDSIQIQFRFNSDPIQIHFSKCDKLQLDISTTTFLFDLIKVEGYMIIISKITKIVTTCPWTGELHTRPKDHYI
ncbi:hypothetical protein VN97_g13029, partial [Penicillium thymicola]